MTVNHLVRGSIPRAGATSKQTPQTSINTNFKSNLASRYDTFHKNHDTIKRLYKVNHTYYYRRRINKQLFRVSLKTKFLQIALKRKKILNLLGEDELFELKTKDYELIFEYDTEEELKQVLSSIKDIQQATITQKVNHYDNVKQKLEMAQESTNELTFGLLENKYIPNKEKKNKVTIATIGDYISTYKLLKKYFETKYINEIKLVEFEEFQKWLDNGERSNRTINKHIRHLKAFTKWAFDREDIKYDRAKPIELLDELKDKQERKMKVENYTDQEINNLLNFDYKDTTYNKIFKILAYSGMRVGELWNIQKEDIEIENSIYYFNIKDSKTLAGIRKVPISYEILDMVLTTDFPLWNNLTKNAFEKRVRSRLYQVIDKGNLKNVHTLRATFIQNVINNNIKNPHIILMVQEIVGHTKGEKNSLTLDTYMKGQELELKLDIINTIEY